MVKVHSMINCSTRTTVNHGLHCLDLTTAKGWLTDMPWASQLGSCYRAIRIAAENIIQDVNSRTMCASFQCYHCTDYQLAINTDVSEYTSKCLLEHRECKHNEPQVGTRHASFMCLQSALRGSLRRVDNSLLQRRHFTWLCHLRPHASSNQ